MCNYLILNLLQIDAQIQDLEKEIQNVRELLLKNLNLHEQAYNVKSDSAKSTDDMNSKVAE